MSAFLAWLESTGLAAWTRESPSLWAYPTILTLHTVGLSVLVGASAVVDLRLLGVGAGIPLSALAALFRLMWLALAVNAASGVLLFIADATTRSQQTVFYVKLAFIAAALVATALTRSIVVDADTVRGGASGAPSVLRGRLLAAASLALWAAAITAGRLMAYL